MLTREGARLLKERTDKIKKEKAGQPEPIKPAKNKVWLINVNFSDDQTYSYTETMAVCTDDEKRAELLAEITARYPNDKVIEEEILTNTIINV